MAERGRAAVLVDDYKFEIREFPTPEVEPEGILVKVTGCGVCGSDLHIWRGDIKLHGYITGHELVGRVHIGYVEVELIVRRRILPGIRRLGGGVAHRIEPTEA